MVFAGSYFGCLLKDEARFGALLIVVPFVSVTKESPAKPSSKLPNPCQGPMQYAYVVRAPQFPFV